MSELLVGRQPIFDQRMEVVGYELLYRSFNGTSALQLDGDLATSRVVVNTFAAIGLDHLVGSKLAFFNCTRNFLLGAVPIPFSPKQIVLEVLENVEIDAALITALTDLARRGYQIALDDVTVLPCCATELLRLVHFVKVDLRGLNRTRVRELVVKLKPYPAKLIAEKVETREELEYCRHLGFNYFQGYFLCRPSVLSGRKVESSRVALVQALAAVQDPHIELPQLAEYVARDVGLSYKLLRLVNSAHYGLAREVTSIRQAVTLLGLNQLRGWLTLLLMTSVEGKPPELTAIAMARARMGEQLALTLKYGPAEPFFLAGLLSVIDALTDTPMREAVADLPLAPEVVEGLVERKGRTGEVLKLVLAHEQGDWDALQRIALPTGQLRVIFVEALDWARETFSALRV